MLVTEELLRLTNAIMSIGAGKFNGPIMAPLSIFWIFLVLAICMIAVSQAIVHKIHLRGRGERERETKKQYLLNKTLHLLCASVGLSLIPRPEEADEEKGPGFSHLHVHLIAMEFHHFCIIYWPTSDNAWHNGEQSNAVFAPHTSPAQTASIYRRHCDTRTQVHTLLELRVNNVHQRWNHVTTEMLFS